MQTVITCFVIIKHKGKFLLVQEGDGSNKGLWSLPGGHVDEAETLEQTAIRECKEEAGVGVNSPVKIFTKIISGAEYGGKIIKKDTPHEVSILKARYLGGEVIAGEEEMDAGWFTLEEIKSLPLRSTFLLDILENQKENIIS